MHNPEYLVHTHTLPAFTGLDVLSLLVLVVAHEIEFLVNPGEVDGADVLSPLADLSVVVIDLAVTLGLWAVSAVALAQGGAEQVELFQQGLQLLP